tara:strand:+ start:827 stop:2635 length:1809 start_codon:yes stop_codon:yes gene_type:complete
MKILGISAFYHDSAAALLDNGEILAAVQEERFTRRKHDAGFPKNAINYVLNYKNLKLEDIDHIVFYDKPFIKFERIIETYIASAPKGFNSFKMSMPIWLREKLFQKILLSKELEKISNQKFDQNKLLFTEHHYSHAASAFYPSPFEEAIVLTLDGVGEWATTTVSIGKGNKLDIIKEIHFPHSLGLLYSAFTYYIGFKVNSGEYKVMGLAPYGKPIYKDIILDKVVDLKDDGSFRLNQSYFNYTSGLTMTNDKFSELFAHPVRKPEIEKLTQFHMDIASSVQSVTEEIILKISRHLKKEYNIPNLCMAGGVALNCVANSKILNEGIFKNIWIQPASGDAGGSIGSALAVWHSEFNKPRKVYSQDTMKGSFLGPEYSQEEIEKSLKEIGATFKKNEENSLIKIIVEDLRQGKVIGWFQGRMEFGPRALGGRSIIADPRSENMQKTLNLKVKFRESFRPFAPSVLKEDAALWFDKNYDNPYMLFVSEVKREKRLNISANEEKLFGIDKLNIKRSEVPAITHVDYSARVQTVEKNLNPKYYKLITSFKEKTGCPMIINTSFNIRGEPIVNSPEDAFKCFMGTEMDILVIGNCILYKNDQNLNLLK